MDDTAALKDAIRDKARTLGFDAVGFAPVRLTDRDKRRLSAFLAAGQHGDMAWMADTKDRRSEPAALWPDAGCVITLGTSYAPGDDPLALLNHPDRAVISVYARNRDYHDLIKKRLKALARWIAENCGAGVKVFVDTAPVLEKAVAARGGIGWQGKHTNLVSRDHGSWLFLGEVFATLDLPPDGDHPDRCGSCTACQTACPTDAFPAPYTLDARRCISYLTIEHKGVIPPEFREAMGNRIYGCDDCLAVCPWNKFAQAAREAAFLPRPELTGQLLRDYLDLDEAGFREMFRASPIKRIGRDRFIRNVLIAVGNSGDDRALPRVLALLDDPAAVVRASAVWALSRLSASDGIEAAYESFGREETAATVRTEWDRALSHCAEKVGA